MEQAKTADRIVKVTNYLTDEAVGYQQQPTQTSSPDPVAEPAALVLFDPERNQALA